MGDECIDLMMRAQQQISYDLVERKNCVCVFCCCNFSTRMVERKNCVCVFLITATRMQYLCGDGHTSRSLLLVLRTDLCSVCPFRS